MTGQIISVYSTETSDNMNQLTEEQVRDLLVIVKNQSLSLIGDGTPDWEDLVQDVMLSMTRGIRIFRGDADIKSLAYVVTKRRFYDYLRRKYKERSDEFYREFAIAFEDPRIEPRSETRMDRINSLLTETKVTGEKRGLLEAAKKSIFSGRIN